MEGGSLTDTFIIPQAGESLDLETMRFYEPEDAPHYPENYKVCNVLSIGFRSKHLEHLVKAQVQVQKKA